MSTELRQARMELRTSESMKELLVKAASLDGMDLTAFVLVSAIEKARQVVKDHATINLSNQGQLNLVEALRNPGQPTPAMKELMALPALEKFDA
jgi:uncharacterized protein (DUF1778 family)